MHALTWPRIQILIDNTEWNNPMLDWPHIIDTYSMKDILNTFANWHPDVMQVLDINPSDSVACVLDEVSYHLKTASDKLRTDWCEHDICNNVELIRLEVDNEKVYLLVKTTSVLTTF